jgi:hypothetical protein
MTAFRIVGLALLVAACSSGGRVHPPHDPSDPAGGSGGGGAGGSGGTIDACDRDGDGHPAIACGGDDCDDDRADVHPGAPELCSEGRDENCDGSIDESCPCQPGDLRNCYPLGLDHPSRGTGACVDGVQRCREDGSGWGDCRGAVTPARDASCDGIDADCDGLVDQGLVNDCGVCGETLPEICGNGLDDDCDGRIDPPELCDVRCDHLDAADVMDCCLGSWNWPGTIARTQLSTTCREDPRLPPCTSEARRCLDLDGDPRTVCSKICQAGQCDCLLEAGGRPVPSATCAFETVCALQDCDDRQNQPCYSGPPQTLGQGICHAGTFSCVQDGDGRRAWSSCEGEQLPEVESCGDGVDNDCDGFIDEEDGATGRTCNIDECYRPDLVELCDDGLDNDCDGFVDEGCAAEHDQQSCYAGRPGTRDVGTCHAGREDRDDTWWSGLCVGAVEPVPDRCGDGLDTDCDGFGGPGEEEDRGCCVPTGAETCNGADDDCDGITDGEVLSACGRCDGSCYDADLLGPDACDAGRCENLELTATGTLRRTGSGPARYTRTFDSGYYTATWDGGLWAADGASTLSVATAVEDVAGAAPCASGQGGFLPLATCRTFGARFARVQVVLDAEATELVTLRLRWTRP